MILIDNDKYELALSRLYGGNKVKEITEEYQRLSIVKFIFFEKHLKSISFDDEVTDIHKLRSKYKGQTNIIIPIEVVQRMDDGISFRRSKEDIEKSKSFVVISKRDIRTSNVQLMRGLTIDIKRVADEYINKALEEYANLINNKVFEMEVKYKDNTIKDWFIDDNFDSLYNQILEKLPFIDDEFDKELKNKFEMLKHNKDF